MNNSAVQMITNMQVKKITFVPKQSIYIYIFSSAVQIIIGLRFYKLCMLTGLHDLRNQVKLL
jgi:hypothetical protein